jgi:hypothetical protein
MHALFSNISEKQFPVCYILAFCSSTLVERLPVSKHECSRQE